MKRICDVLVIGLVIATTFAGCLGVEKPHSSGTAVERVTAYIEVNKINAKVGEMITFDGSKSISENGEIVSWIWNFGDSDDEFFGAIVQHSYGVSGTYRVSLTVTDEIGEKASHSINILISKSESSYKSETIASIPPPKADFTYIVETLRSKPRVIFIDKTDVGYGRNISYKWDFGDGFNSTAKNAVHKYAEFGIYNVSLTVRSEYGSNHVSHTINVTEPEEEDVNSTTIFDILGSVSDSMANKWAILGTDDYENVPSSTTEREHWFSTTLWVLYDVIVQLGVPEEHIIVLLNEQFTKKNLNVAMDFIDRSSLDPKNATVIFWYLSHGASTPGLGGVDITGGTPFHSLSMIRVEDSSNEHPEWDNIYDYELKEILDKHTYAKTLVFILSCESGNYAAQDTTGKTHNTLNFLYTSCGGPNRIVIASSTAPLLSFGSFDGKDAHYTYFWKEGLLNGKGDSNQINGNNDKKTSVEEAFYYYKTVVDFNPAIEQPCMNDQYPAENPDEEMFL